MKLLSRTFFMACSALLVVGLFQNCAETTDVEIYNRTSRGPTPSPSPDLDSRQLGPIGNANTLKPTFLTEYRRVDSGETAQFKANFNATLPSAQYTWVKEDTGVVVSSKTTNGFLSISGASASDAGYYVLTVTSSIGYLSARAKLDVGGVPAFGQMHIGASNPMSGALGDTRTINILTTPTLGVQYSWFKVNSNLSIISEILSTSSQLVFSPIIESSYGLYKAVASNEFGTDTAYVELRRP